MGADPHCVGDVESAGQRCHPGEWQVPMFSMNCGSNSRSVPTPGTFAPRNYFPVMPDRAALLELFDQVRKRIEASDLTIDWQHEIIAALEKEGLPTDKARLALDRLVAARQVDHAEIERLLDEMELATLFGLDVVSVSEPGTKGLDQG